MVLVNLSKLISLVNAINNCPLGVPQRSAKLMDAYNKLTTNSEDVVSIEVSAWLEKFKEQNIDTYEETEKEKILIQIIDKFSESGLKIPLLNTKVYLVPSVTKCHLCPENPVLILNRRRKGVSSILYTKTGPSWVESFKMHCPKCAAVFFANYWESNGQRGYYQDRSDIFSITCETFFSQDLLIELNEDIVTCETRFVSFCTKYNRLYVQPEMPPLYRKRLQNCWQIFAIWKKMPVVFPVIRNVDRSLDLEKIMKFLYPTLKAVIDTKWLDHTCVKCDSRLCVLDGDAKSFRAVCAARGEKIVKKAMLNEFSACINTPLPGELFCEQHLAEKTGQSDERLDVRLTRAKVCELGLDIEKLQESGCRKREDITVRRSREHTAGMIYAYRTCGIREDFIVNIPQLLKKYAFSWQIILSSLIELKLVGVQIQKSSEC